ncbi:VIP2-like ADP-ribosyltransferase toxin [Gordonia phage Nedarya]|nr:VIP2-like ADP-ribosyltransferase toxin [Gordonia phage Nedarya]
MGGRGSGGGGPVRGRRGAGGAGAGAGAGSSGGSAGGGASSGGGSGFPGNTGTGGVIGGGGSGGSGGGGGSSTPIQQQPNPFDSFFDYVNARQGRIWAYNIWGGKSNYSPAVAQAFGDYSGSTYRDINQILRETKGDLSRLDDPSYNPTNEFGQPIDKQYIKQTIQNMDLGMDGAPRVPQSLNTQRGTTWLEFSELGITGAGDDLSKLVGKTYTDNQYKSVSIDKNAAFSSKDVQITIRVSAGTKAVHMAGDKDYNDALSYHKAEQELLLGRGTKYKIVSAKRVNGKWKIEVVTIP